MGGPQLIGAHVKADGVRLHCQRYGGRGAPPVMLPAITSLAKVVDEVREDACADRSGTDVAPLLDAQRIAVVLAACLTRG